MNILAGAVDSAVEVTIGSPSLLYMMITVNDLVAAAAAVEVTICCPSFLTMVQKEKP